MERASGGKPGTGSSERKTEPAYYERGSGTDKSHHHFLRNRLRIENRFAKQVCQQWPFL
jgi:hypothetical protein